ncbi:alpha/beta hydrolase family protein [Umezawaea tangerina]|nr:alpha/beta fold hydrolase [Umezawaea tangerina]
MTRSAGCRTVELMAEAPFPVLVMYPSTAPERPEPFGPYTAEVALDGPVEPGAHPLVVVSHGTGGSHLLYRTLAAHLARAGFVVALPEHPLNNRNDNELGGTSAILANRPRHVRQVVDWASGAFDIGPVAVVGHSLGGCTGLALAGGTPTAFPHETPDRQPHPVDVTPDERVRALVLLAPATAWFQRAGSLAAVDVPVLMLTAEHDEHTPPWHAEIVTTGVADVEHRVVPGAGHYSFLAPFPERMANPAFPPSQDPPGFDRQAFHEELNAEVLAFLGKVL